MHKDGKWAQQVIELQNDEGHWNYFHTLSEPKLNKMTTEHAMRRLEILGFTYKDESIKKVIKYMNCCLMGDCEIPDRKEKHDHWSIFVDLMLATWIRRFTVGNELANAIALKWAKVIEETFKSGDYSRKDYDKIYFTMFNVNVNKNLGHEIRRFYNVSIVKGLLSSRVEDKFFDYILNSDKGIYYVYDKPLRIVPNEFMSRETSRYLAAIDLLADYETQRHKLKFVEKWLMDNQMDDGRWDLGSASKDNVYLPLSDDWRSKERRIIDCTYKIENLLERLR